MVEAWKQELDIVNLSLRGWSRWKSSSKGESRVEASNAL